MSSRVFVIQQPGDRFDYANLHTFGGPVFVLPTRHSSSLYTDDARDLIQNEFVDFDYRQDYIMDSAGDRFNAYLVAFHLFVNLRVPSIMFLRWNRHEQMFSPIEVEFPELSQV